MKRLISFVITVLILSTLFACPVYSAELVTEDGVVYSDDMTVLIRYPYLSEAESFTVPDTVVRIEENAFYYNRNLKEVKLNKGLVEIGENAFSDCAELRGIVIPNSVTAIRSQAFFECEKLQSVKIPDGVTTVGDYAFYCCKSLKKLVIPKTVKKIGLCVDEDCTKLKSVTIPKSVKAIGSYAFGFGKYDEEQGVYHKRSGFVLKGYKGTAAQTYAKEYKIKFKKLG